MKISSKEKKVKKEKKKVSMREAFESIKGIKIKERKNGEDSGFRFVWWKYPIFLAKIVRGSRPLSYIFLFAILGLISCLFIVNTDFLERVKNEEKSSFVEGSVGAISSLNPIFLTQNTIDKSIHELVFEKFVEIDKDGNPLPGVAKSWDVSDDSLTYSFDIENNHHWQDGKPLTIDDVVFTFESAIKLAEKYNADSVGVPLVGMKVEKVDDDTVSFVLENRNAIFFEAVSIYILPKHRLESVNLGDLQFDVFTKYPLGSGPYKVIKSEPNIVIMEASKYFQESISNDPIHQRYVFR